MQNKATQIKKIDNHTFVANIKRILNSETDKSVTFIIQGYSMRPFLEHNRDKVVLIKPQSPQIGQVVLAEIAPQTYALHRIIKIEDNTITMQGDGNQISQTEVFTTDKIVGTATAFIRKGKRVSVDSKKWKNYSALWLKLNPIRRIILGIHRRIIKYINI